MLMLILALTFQCAAEHAIPHEDGGFTISMALNQFALQV